MSGVPRVTPDLARFRENGHSLVTVGISITTCGVFVPSGAPEDLGGLTGKRLLY